MLCFGFVFFVCCFILPVRGIDGGLCFFFAAYTWYGPTIASGVGGRGVDGGKGRYRRARWFL